MMYLDCMQVILRSIIDAPKVPFFAQVDFLKTILIRVYNNFS